VDLPLFTGPPGPVVAAAAATGTATATATRVRPAQTSLRAGRAGNGRSSR